DRSLSRDAATGPIVEQHLGPRHITCSRTGIWEFVRAGPRHGEARYDAFTARIACDARTGARVVHQREVRKMDRGSAQPHAGERTARRIAHGEHRTRRPESL